MSESLQFQNEDFFDEDTASVLSGNSNLHDNGTEELIENRKLINELLFRTGKEGDIWYLIASQYLDRVLNEPVNNMNELKELLGPLCCDSIVDSEGNLYPEESEPVGTYNIIPELFHLLVELFGIKGNPVARSLILNSETGELGVERFPPSFQIHQLVKQASEYQNNKKYVVKFSSTKTFGELHELIKNSQLEGIHKTNKIFRLWIIEFPSTVKISNNISFGQFLNEIPNKNLLHRGLYPDTLKYHGIKNSHYHLMVEHIDRQSQIYPIDNYITNIDLSQCDVDAPFKKGGNLGLQNLGNTCYMNSALQCLLHIPEINYYFLCNVFSKELNLDNPLGNNGNVASSFGSLLKQAFDSTTKSTSISPREFKYTIGHYSSMFLGYHQHDSQEFLSWLLDALHEDLNRIHKKPYCEKPELKDEEVDDPSAISKLADTCWSQHKLRNDSVIVDLFTGLYQSTLKCPTCSKVSITFDPYNDLTLSLPVSKKWYHTFTIVDLSDISKFENSILKLEVELNKNSSFDDLKKYISTFLNIDPKFLFFYEIFQNSFYADLQRDYKRNKFLPIEDIIRDSDEIFVYIIPHNPLTDIIVPVLHVVDDSDKSYQIKEFFAIPTFIVIEKENEVRSFGSIRKELEKTCKVLTKLNLENEYEKLKLVNKKYFNRKDFPLLNSGESNSSQDNEDMDEAYDSDVSQASPYISGNLGFEIKYYNSLKQANRQQKGRFYFNHRLGGGNENEEDGLILTVPLYKPAYSEFKQLSDKLPELKRKFYHYPDYKYSIQQVDTKQGDHDNANNDIQVMGQKNHHLPQNTDLSSNTEDEFVIVNNESDFDPSKSTPQQSLLDDESEMNLGSLLDSNTLPAPPSYPLLVKDNSNEEIVSINEGDNHPLLIEKNTILLCDWDSNVYSEYFSQPESQNWNNVPMIPNPELEKSKAIIEKQRNASVSLYDCLKSFSTPEVLGEHDLWYCPRCKDHKQATKTIQLWSTGDILTIHLKRFHSARAFSDKIDILVDFPIENLDMSEFISSPNKEEQIYDLIAVDNHYGGLGGGHYTASVKNFRDDLWYYFNDGRVTKIEDSAKCVTNAAYLLFYRRRSSKEFLGGNNLEELINSGRESLKSTYTLRKNNLESLLKQVDNYNNIESQLRISNNGEIDELSSKDNSNKKSRSPSINSGELFGNHILDGQQNIRKQRLISKENNNNKLIQIKSNGKEEYSSSPNENAVEEDF